MKRQSWYSSRDEDGANAIGVLTKLIPDLVLLKEILLPWHNQKVQVGEAKVKF